MVNQFNMLHVCDNINYLIFDNSLKFSKEYEDVKKDRENET